MAEWTDKYGALIKKKVQTFKKKGNIRGKYEKLRALFVIIHISKMYQNN
jgi:hypothetical protein